MKPVAWRWKSSWLQQRRRWKPLPYRYHGTYHPVNPYAPGMHAWATIRCLMCMRMTVLFLPWCQVERLLVEASAAESVAELLFTEAVSEDVANTMTLAGLDVVTQVVRR